MAKPSKRDLARQQRLAELRAEGLGSHGPASADLTTSTSESEAADEQGTASPAPTPTQEPAPALSMAAFGKESPSALAAGPVKAAVPSPHQGEVADLSTATGIKTAVDQRARGAGMTKTIAILSGGLAGRLAETEALLDEKQRELEKANAIVEELRMRMESVSQGGDAAVQRFDPQTVRFTKFENRDKKSFTDDDKDFRLLRLDIKAKEGNVMPGLVRPLDPPEGPYLYEVVYGNRRLACCSQEGVQFRAFLQSVSDEAAMRLMFVENTFRKKLSTIESARQVHSFLEFQRTSDGKRVVDGALVLMVETLQMDKSYLSKLNMIGSMPKEVFDAIPDVREIPYRPALQLAKTCRDNLDDVLARLPTVDKEWRARKVVAHLIGSSPSQRTPMAEGRYRLTLPRDADVRAALQEEFKTLESKYGIRFHFALEPGGDTRT